MEFRLRNSTVTPTPTPVFLVKSAESLENKRVEFLVSAKKRKRVRKNLKRKGIGDGNRGTSGSRSYGEGQSGYTHRYSLGYSLRYSLPIKMDRFQNKGVAGKAFCNLLELKAGRAWHF